VEGAIHTEDWVTQARPGSSPYRAGYAVQNGFCRFSPAEELDEFNANIVGLIEVIEEFR